MEEKKSVMILSIVQGNDGDEAIRELNEHGYNVTLLSTTGGFLRRKSTTLLIGTEEEKLQEVLDLLKTTAGRRKITEFQTTTGYPDGSGLAMSSASHAVPVETEVGGAVVFVMSLDKFERF